MSNLISVRTNEKISVVTINNPPVNVLNKQVIKELDDIFAKLEEDNEVSVVILTGSGEKAFVAGADIKEFPEWMKDENAREMALTTHEMQGKINKLSKPVIACLNGITLGGGSELALCCDLRIAESHVKIGLPEVTLGIIPGGGGTQRLPRVVGKSKAMEIMMTGEPLSAKEAYRLGIVDHLVPKGEGISYSLSLAQKIAQHSLLAISRIKKAVNSIDEKSLEKGLLEEASLFGSLFSSYDAKEGIEAFIEKRVPSFKNK